MGAPDGRGDAPGPYGRGSFVVVHEFMWRDLGLSGAALLVYARAFGFCRSGGTFYESKSHLAGYLGLSERTVFRAVSDLLGAGLLVEVGEIDLGYGRLVKEYSIDRSAVPTGEAGWRPDDMSGGWEGRHDMSSGRSPEPPDRLAGGGMSGCHPISKEDNQAFR